jgi:outer membrane protein TolC
MRAAHRIALVLLCGRVAYAAPPPAAAPPAVDGMTLSEACSRAFAISEAVQTAEQTVGEARAKYRGALTLIGPQIALRAGGSLQNVEYETNLVTDPMTGMLTTQRTIGQPLLGLTAGATLVQPLFRRSVFPARTAARHGIDASEATLERTREQLTLDVTEAFVAVMQAREQLHVAESSVQRSESILTMARARIKAGGSLPSAEPLAWVSVEAAQVRQARAIGDVRQNEATFQRLVGVAPPAKLVLPATPSPATLEQSLDVARRRADLKAAGSAILQSRALEGSLAGNILWPKLDLTGSYAYNFPAVFDVVHAWNVSAVLTVPLIQSGDEWTQLKLQRFATEIATLDRSLLDKQVTEQVRRASAEVEVATQVAQLAEKQLAAAQQYFELIQRQLKLGAVSFLEVTIAQNTLSDAESQRVQTAYERDLAIYRLLFATGALKL